MTYPASNDHRVQYAMRTSPEAVRRHIERCRRIIARWERINSASVLDPVREGKGIWL